MRSRARAQRNGRHSGQGLEPMGQGVDQRERARHGRYRLKRMNIGKPRKPRQLLVEPRVVFHRARAERIKRRCRLRSFFATIG